MEFLTHSLLGFLVFLPSILLLFGLYLIWEQSRLLNKQVNGIALLLAAIHDERHGGSAASRRSDET